MSLIRSLRAEVVPMAQQEPQSVGEERVGEGGEGMRRGDNREFKE